MAQWVGPHPPSCSPLGLTRLSVSCCPQIVVGVKADGLLSSQRLSLLNLCLCHLAKFLGVAFAGEGRTEGIGWQLTFINRFGTGLQMSLPAFRYRHHNLKNHRSQDFMSSSVSVVGAVPVRNVLSVSAHECSRDHLQALMNAVVLKPFRIIKAPKHQPA